MKVVNCQTCPDPKINLPYRDQEWLQSRKSLQFRFDAVEYRFPINALAHSQRLKPASDLFSHLFFAESYNPIPLFHEPECFSNHIVRRVVGATLHFLSQKPLDFGCNTDVHMRSMCVSDNRVN